MARLPRAGLEHAAVWSIAAGVLNLVPYIGPLIVSVGASLAALLQFGTLETAALVAGVSVALHVVCGYLLTAVAPESQ